MTLTPQWLDELRSRITLSTLIGRTVKVTRAGREYKACCPFHNEKTPSFTINDEKGFYHCFGCSAHGDAIRWMTDQRGRSEEHTSELQSLMRISYAVYCLKNKNNQLKGQQPQDT